MSAFWAIHGHCPYELSHKSHHQVSPNLIPLPHLAIGRQQLSPSPNRYGSLAGCHHLLSRSNPIICISQPPLSLLHPIRPFLPYHCEFLDLFIFSPNSPFYYNAFPRFSIKNHVAFVLYSISLPFEFSIKRKITIVPCPVKKFQNPSNEMLLVLKIINILFLKKKVKAL